MILRRLVGFLFISAAVAGAFFGGVGLFEIWRYRPVVTKTVIDNLALFDQALNTTQDGLSIVSQVLQTTTGDVTSLLSTTQALAQAIHSTNPMLDSLISLTSKDLPNALSATQTSLASAQISAQLIDNVLAALTTIPFSPVASYQPNVPLHTALAQVSTSLNPLTTSLAAITTSLADGKTELGVVETELYNISETTKAIGSTLGNAQAVIGQYKAATTQLKARVEAVQLSAASWITTITWILSIFIEWLLIAQLGLAAQGLEMLRDRQEAK